MGFVYLPKGRTRYMIKYQKDGRWIPESTGTTDRDEADKILKAREVDIERGAPVDAGTGKIRFEQAAANMEADYKLKDQAFANVRTKIEKHLKPVFSRRRLASITAGQIRKYASDKIEEGYQPGEVRLQLAALKRMFTLAFKDGRILQKPAFPTIKGDNVRTGFFERHEFDTLCKHLPPAYRDVALFAYLTGWRVQSEVLPLQWGTNVAEDRVRLLTSKNGERRVFPFAVLPELAALFARLRAAEDRRQRKTKTICPWVFHVNGTPMCHPSGWASKDFRDVWRAANTAAGLDRIPHDFRRTAVRNLVRAGVPDKIAMTLTGHKTRSVFDRYDIVNESDLETAVARLADYMAAPPAPSAPRRGRIVPMGANVTKRFQDKKNPTLSVTTDVTKTGRLVAVSGGNRRRIP